MTGESREVLLHYIQEFYQVTLLNTQKSCEQKLEEVNHMADKWEKSVSIQNSEPAHSCPVEEQREQSCSEPSGMEQGERSAKTSEGSLLGRFVVGCVAWKQHCFSIGMVMSDF
ncbi:hypothetical protein L3Q82_006362 [Scortum barcoo]|uniref:Uncharacterized protein n=1 Tax=Scortum barcoo TaxID=214431 RepID=A0ACB8WZB5_9TELE|nr:hypothetical protein L3Q82_006362 [Scortum barcoo]